MPRFNQRRDEGTAYREGGCLTLGGESFEAQYQFDFSHRLLKAFRDGAGIHAESGESEDFLMALVPLWCGLLGGSSLILSVQSVQFLTHLFGFFQPLVQHKDDLLNQFLSFLEVCVEFHGDGLGFGNNLVEGLGSVFTIHDGFSPPPDEDDHDDHQSEIQQDLHGTYEIGLFTKPRYEHLHEGVRCPIING